MSTSTPPPHLSADMPDTPFDLDTDLYDNAVRLFRFVKRFLHIHFKLHDPDDFVHQGHIFVFNHFARFETLIPQYLIYESSGAYCCAIAHRELFEINERLSRFLQETGAIPHDHPTLFPLLASHILRGRKVIIFPEGGMVKDRRVIDRKGRYRIYSRTTRERRKQHTGAAVLGLGLEIFKRAVTMAERTGLEDKLEGWCRELNLPDRATLVARCQEPTRIVPANITFVPLRIDDNLIEKLVTNWRPNLNRRYLEELLIESNLLLKHTDMDIHLAQPIDVNTCWRWWERALVQRLAPKVKNLADVFTWHNDKVTAKRVLAHSMERNARCIRNRYMEAMYQAVTVNLCHLASTLIYTCLEQKQHRISRETFYRALYLTIKKLQRLKGIFLHRGLRNPSQYQQLPLGEPVTLNQFFCTAESAGLIEPVGGCYYFLPKLCEEFEIDTIRLENPVAVYANEVAPLSRVKEAVADSLSEAENLTPDVLARLRFDDEIRSFQWDHEFFSTPCFAPVNREEGLKVSGEPFLLLGPPQTNKGILLIHGLLASPAVMRPLGEELARAGYHVLGIRLKGHGTSPCDLRERSWQDWLHSVQQGYQILAGLSESVALVGFSSGGLLALHLASDQPDRLTSVVAVAPPLKFRTPIMHLVPLVFHAGRLTHWMTNGGLKQFVVNSSEHPETNYTHIPIHALYQLRQLIRETENRLAGIHCPVLLLQGDGDPVVDPDSSRLVYDRLGSGCKMLSMIPSKRHDIVYHDPGHVHAFIHFFLDQYISYTYLPS